MRGFTFILSNIKINNYEPIELIENYILRKAADDEIEIIKNELNKITIHHPFNNKDKDFIYEFNSKEVQKNETTISYEKEPLTKNNFRYWVIEFDINYEIESLETSINLLKNSFELGFTFMYPYPDNKERPIIGYSEYIINKYKTMEQRYIKYNAIDIDINEIISISKIYKQLKNNSDKYTFIKHSINNFNSLKYINYDSDLLLVGYFSIIETLVTHSPRLQESIDSISHQIVNKLNLLQKFFLRQINYNDYFENSNEDTIWKKLYSYRSDIAHGNIVDFNKKYILLKSNENIKFFLIEIIKNLILLALDKSDLLNDLKKC